MTTPSVLERIVSMDDFQVVRFFQYWSSNLCDGAITEYETIVDGIPAEIGGSAEFVAIRNLSPEQSVAPLRPADSVRLARALLERLAQTPELAPSIQTALDFFDDDKLVVDVILALGLVASVLLIVSTVEFEGKIGPVSFHKGKVDPETLKAVTEFVAGILTPYVKSD